MKKNWKTIIPYCLAALWSIVNLVPLFLVIISAFKTTNEIYLGPFSPPKTLNFHNFDTAILHSGVLRGIFNSFFYAVVSVSAILIIAMMAGYVLSRYKGRLINALYIYFVLGVLVPVQATFIPLVGTVGRLQMHNKPITMFIIYVTFNLPVSILLLTGYMKSISREIDEAATIDGCGPFRAFLHVIAPLSGPSAATAGILAFINIYNDLIFATLFISKIELRTITQVVSGFSAQYNSDIGATFAALVIAIMPMIFIFMCFQEKVIDGLSSGAVKG